MRSKDQTMEQFDAFACWWNALLHSVFILFLLLTGADVLHAQDAEIQKNKNLTIVPINRADPMFSREFSEKEKAFRGALETDFRGISLDRSFDLLNSDIVLGRGDARQSLVIFVSPSCVYCFNGLMTVARKVDFKNENIVLKMAPNVEPLAMIMSMYIGCGTADPGVIIDRFNWANQLMSPKFYNGNNDDEIAAIAQLKFGINDTAAHSCRSLVGYSDILSNVMTLFAQCKTGSIECGKGLYPVDTAGNVIEVIGPNAPTWFRGEVSSGNPRRFHYVDAGVGETSLVNAFH
jgi:hypothetical protein